jgi:hypothetical protein
MGRGLGGLEGCVVGRRTRRGRRVDDFYDGRSEAARLWKTGCAKPMNARRNRLKF